MSVNLFWVPMIMAANTSVSYGFWYQSYTAGFFMFNLLITIYTSLMILSHRFLR